MMMRFFIALVYSLSLTSAFSQQAAKVTLFPKQVSSSVWYVEGATALGSVENKNFISNAAFVVGSEGVIVIDALGSPVLADALIDAIQKITSKKIAAVIVTHYHADHIYGLQSFKKLGAKIIAHPAAREYLNSETAKQRLEVSRTELAPWVDQLTLLVEADDWIAKETNLKLAGIELLVKPVGPSHTPEDLVIYFPKEKILFTGDLLFRGRLPFIGATADTKPWIEALSSFLSLNAAIAVPGHGGVSETAPTDIVMLRDYLVYLRETMGKAVDELELFDEAYAATDWKQFEAIPMFKFANRMNAYNTYLQLLDKSK